MTKGTGKRHVLTQDQLIDLWELIEDMVPANKENGWLLVVDADPLLATERRGRKWNGPLFAEYATAKLGFVVKASNVNGLLKARGYQLREPRDPKPSKGSAHQELVDAHNNLFDRFDQHLKRFAHVEAVSQQVFKLQTGDHADLRDVLAYLTRQDQNWREKAHADLGITS